ncbi:hypothetical protein CAL29_05735 [Bordetella genomosp. 10]|uniref:Sulfate exporter family transporter n=1 Tax=Bordetella genomosp. 10 TaxID=1416804 RepID=A0A261SKB0_9BORD|nr:putative sulfate exporter family transporter [Bordetella genomosp. 10]OZI37868.1 hypothetical protein CAL29_05735 [Bordetella genomosp. 10]
MNSLTRLHPVVPGLILSAGVALASVMAEQAEIALTGRAWLEALVIAILLGALVRTIWRPAGHFKRGIGFSAKTALEVAVALMGAQISFGAVARAGLPLVAGIAGTVVVAIAFSFMLGRSLGLPGKMSLLVACGNAICGNSAIAAVAPVIDADSDDVATSIAFTAVLGIAVVIALPFIAGALHLSPQSGGILAGLTVYAVPQVIAAAGPMGAAAIQVGTLVKLVRVLMLGPVVAVVSLLISRRAAAPGTASRVNMRSFTRFMPVFILAFLALAMARSLDVLPHALLSPAQSVSNLLTVLAMAGLGLGVDLRSVTAAGPRVVIVVTASLLLLGLIAYAMLRFMGLT